MFVGRYTRQIDMDGGRLARLTADGVEGAIGD